MDKLTDFDWSTRLTLSSDKLSALRKPTLLLKLDLESVNGSPNSKIVELSTEELGDLLAKLQAAQSIIHRT